MSFQQNYYDLLAKTSTSTRLTTTTTRSYKYIILYYYIILLSSTCNDILGVITRILFPRLLKKLLVLVCSTSILSYILLDIWEESV